MIDQVEQPVVNNEIPPLEQSFRTQFDSLFTVISNAQPNRRGATITMDSRWTAIPSLTDNQIFDLATNDINHAQEAGYYDSIVNDTYGGNGRDYAQALVARYKDSQSLERPYALSPQHVDKITHILGMKESKGGLGIIPQGVDITNLAIQFKTHRSAGDSAVGHRAVMLEGKLRYSQDKDDSYPGILDTVRSIGDDTAEFQYYLVVDNDPQYPPNATGTIRRPSSFIVRLNEETHEDFEARKKQVLAIANQYSTAEEAMKDLSVGREDCELLTYLTDLVTSLPQKSEQPAVAA